MIWRIEIFNNFHEIIINDTTSVCEVTASSFQMSLQNVEVDVAKARERPVGWEKEIYVSNSKMDIMLRT